MVILDKESHWHGFLLRTPASLSAVHTILYAHLYLSMTLGSSLGSGIPLMKKALLADSMSRVRKGERKCQECFGMKKVIRLLPRLGFYLITFSGGKGLDGL